MRRTLFITTLILLFAGCSGARVETTLAPAQAEMASDRTIEVTILQMNDVYEITPVEGGKRGGLARVATVRDQLLAENPNTITVIAGDFYSPSALGTAQVDGERLAGKQMVAVLNELGLDYAAYGNHEFDVDRESFYQRIEESAFEYLASNITDENGHLFPSTATHYILKFPGQPGDTLRMALVGSTLDSNQKEYVRYSDPLATIKQLVDDLANRTDAQIALTHLAIDQDEELAAEVPELDLIMGGHEHENIQVLRGPDLTPITKADANARTVYIHRLTFDPVTKKLEVASDIKLITDAIQDDPATAQVVDKWVDIAFAGFREQGLKPGQPVVTLTEPMDGRESSVRNESTRLTDLIAQAMLSAASDADVSIYNSGSIRIDDVLPPGTLIEYDVIRILPFGGDILIADMKGSLLDSTLTQGVDNKGSGGFLQHAGVVWEDGAWKVDGNPIDPDQTYRVAINDFLASGRESGLNYLSFNNPSMTQVESHGDIRFAVIAELKKQYGEK
ncbi:MAG TPA: bifunctional metallophosphatase/5'-nucleotidase [Rhodothermales bacterium]|nr:bifunctional metallophosphatase/5'-nucleotidase [Rhodothermales bacterium]